MDTGANQNEIRLRAGETLAVRLVVAGFGILLCLVALVGQSSGIVATIAFLIGALLLAGAILRRSVVWIIRSDEILIREQRPFGRLHSRQVTSDEISEMHLRQDSANSSKFTLAFTARSGDVLISPSLPDVTQVHDTTARIARLLALPDPAPIDNPLDATNTEIRLGKPVERRRGAGNRILIVLIAGLLSFPFFHALWNGQLSALGATVWSLIVAGAIALFRYAHRISGTFWIVRDGEIRVERLALNGAPDMQTIGGDDVAAVNVEPGNSEDNTYVIAIKLRNGKKVRSAEIEGEGQAEALRTEIVRRLNLSEIETPAR